MSLPGSPPPPSSPSSSSSPARDAVRSTPGLPDPAAGPPPLPPLPLERLVHEVDRWPEPADRPAVLRVAEHPLRIDRLLLDDGGHPLDLLLGFTAPPGWAGIGLRCRGHAYDLCPPALSSPDDLPPPCGTGAPPDPLPGRDDRVEPVAVVVTVLLDRTGHGAGALRRGDAVTRLDGPPEGVVGDALRRSLGLPTRPAPASTVDLWLRIWLDRIVEAHMLDDEAQRAALGWAAVVAEHPAAPGRPTALRANARSTREPQALADAFLLADATLQLAELWPWSRLRHDPEVIDTARPPLPRHVTAWMDDGMFARWVLSDVIALDMLAASVDAVLSPALTAAVAETVTTAGAVWPDLSRFHR